MWMRGGTAVLLLSRCGYRRGRPSICGHQSATADSTGETQTTSRATSAIDCYRLFITWIGSIMGHQLLQVIASCACLA